MSLSFNGQLPWFWDPIDTIFIFRFSPHRLTAWCWWTQDNHYFFFLKFIWLYGRNSFHFFIDVQQSYTRIYWLLPADSNESATRKTEYLSNWHAENNVCTSFCRERRYLWYSQNIDTKFLFFLYLYRFLDFGNLRDEYRYLLLLWGSSKTHSKMPDYTWRHSTLAIFICELLLKTHFEVIFTNRWRARQHGN